MKYYAKKIVADVRELINNFMIMIGLREPLGAREKSDRTSVEGASSRGRG